MKIQVSLGVTAWIRFGPYWPASEPSPSEKQSNGSKKQSWNSLPPLSATIGGALIGLAAVLLMAFNGRIAGISGVFSGAVFAAPDDKLWRLFCVIGLIAAPLVYILAGGTVPNFQITSNWGPIVVGGLLSDSGRGSDRAAPAVMAVRIIAATGLLHGGRGTLHGNRHGAFRTD